MALRLRLLSLPLVLRVLVMVGVLVGLSLATSMLEGWGRVYGSAISDASLNDYMPHWSSGALARAGQAAAVYDAAALHNFYTTHFGLSAQASVWGYVYPPVTLLLARSLAFGDYLTSATVFFSLSLLLFLLVAYCWAGGAGVLLAFGFSGVWICLDSGQLTLLIATLLGFGLFYLERRPLLAGVLIGLVCLKPQFGVLLPLLLLVGGYRKSFVAASGTVLALIALSVLLDGPETWLAFIQKGMPALLAHPANEPLWPRYLTVFGLLARGGWSLQLAAWGQGVTALLATGLTLLIWRQTTAIELRAAALLLGTLLISPMFYDYDLPVALLALLMLLRASSAMWPRQAIAPLLASALLLYLLPVFSVTLMPLLLWLLLLQIGVLSRSAEFRVSHA